MESRNRTRSEGLICAALESCPTGVVLMDRTGTITLVNAEAERLFQSRREDLAGKRLEMLVPPRFRADLPKFEHAPPDDPRSQPSKAREIPVLRKDGSELPTEIRVSRIPNDDSIIVSIADVSDRKHRDRNKDEFVAMVSHELRTPMTSIAASLGLLVADSSSKLSDAAKRLL